VWGPVLFHRAAQNSGGGDAQILESAVIAKAKGCQTA